MKFFKYSLLSICFESKLKIKETKVRFSDAYPVLPKDLKSTETTVIVDVGKTFQCWKLCLFGCCCNCADFYCSACSADVSHGLCYWKNESWVIFWLSVQWIGWVNIFTVDLLLKTWNFSFEKMKFHIKIRSSIEQIKLSFSYLHLIQWIWKSFDYKNLIRRKLF